MDTSIGSIVGTIIIILFGAGIAYVVPKMIRNEGPEQGMGDVPIDKWIRILGLVVMIVGIIQAILMFVL
jgi:hypothetical protein